jgi:putative methionine-R-sulfoxide reductase with GAF domain
MIPIKLGAADDVVGTLDVEAARENAFSAADREFLEECAGAAAGLWEWAGACPR